MNKAAQMDECWRQHRWQTRDREMFLIMLEMQHMDETLSGCDWCEGCGDGILWYRAWERRLDALEDAEAGDI